jgi:hypothetical protein
MAATFAPWRGCAQEMPRENLKFLFKIKDLEYAQGPASGAERDQGNERFVEVRREAEESRSMRAIPIKRRAIGASTFAAWRASSAVWSAAT